MAAMDLLAADEGAAGKRRRLALGVGHSGDGRDGLSAAAERCASAGRTAWRV